MAVSVLMSPTTPNVTNTNLVYTLSSSLSSNPQFRYVTDIYESGSSNLLVRLTTYPNTYGTVNLDVSRELNDHIDWDNNWKTAGSVAPINAVKTFDLRFGEEYGTSISSSTTIYTGSTPNYLQVFPGHVYANQGSYNFNTSSFVSASSSPYLSNDPAIVSSNGFPNGQYGYTVNSTDYLTITTLKDIVTTPARVTVTAGKLLNGVFTQVTSSNINLVGLNGEFNTIGLGPQNLSDWNAGYANYIASESINYYHTSNDGGGAVVVINNLWDGIPYKGAALNLKASDITKQCSEEYTRFAFINQYGFWDYYNVYNPLRRQSQVRRSTYDRSFVSYGNLQASYDITNRGTTQYYTQYNDIYEITTDYLNKEYADWLTELFESPDVYIQSGSDFIPVNILNTEVTWNLDQNRNKLFQYTISFKYANQRESR